MSRFYDILNSVNKTLSEDNQKNKLDNKISKAEENETPEMEMKEYKQDFYEMSVASIRAIATHAMEILNSLENPTIQENLTESWLQGRIAITEDYMRTIHDYIMYTKEEASKADDYNDINQSELGPSTIKNLDDEENNSMTNHLTAMYHCVAVVMDKLKNPDTHKRLTNAGWHDKIQAMSKTTGEMKDFVMNVPLADDDKTLIAVDKPGLWDNIRKKKEREGKNYRPAKPGDKDRPDSDQWKKLTK